MKKLLSILVFLCLLCSTAYSEETIIINFPTASASGTLYAVGAAITNLWNTKIPYVKASSQSSAGGIENLNLVSDGEAQVSIAIASNVYQCLNGLEAFEGYAYEDLKVIGGLYLNPNQIVVNQNDNINSLYDIKGKSFAVASMGSSVYGECYNHFTSIGLKFPKDINCQYISFADASDLLQNGRIDGAWIMSGAPAPAVAQALSGKAKLLDINEEILQILQKKYPWYVPYIIKAGTYPKQNKDINTTAIKMVLFCRGDLPENVVYELTKVLWENLAELKNSLSVFKEVEVNNALIGIADLPVHPGAMKYYEEIKPAN